MTRETISNEDRGVSLKSVKHILYEVCLHYGHKEIFGKLLERVDELRDWEEYLTIKQQPKEVIRMEQVKIGQVIVDSYGISKVIKLDDFGGYTAEQIIPKEVFIEAYNKWIIPNIVIAERSEG